MNAPAEKLPPRATYADLLAVPDRFVAERIGGQLRVMPRPAPKHARVSSRIGVVIGGAFDGDDGGEPGGWCILDEPELHFPDPLVPGEPEVLVPDLAGWTLERMPELPETSYFALAPDWICEVLSRSTEDFDRDEKMPVYAREGVRHAWLVDPVAQTLEVYALGPKRQWVKVDTHAGAARVRVPPFDAIEINLSRLWPAPRLVR